MPEDKSYERIKSINLKLTDVCNLNCIMCGQRKRKEGTDLKNHIPLKDLTRFLEDSPKGLFYYLWGGEPLLYPDLPELLNFTDKKNAKVIINTNGLLLNKKMDLLTEHKITTILVSLDGLEKTHDKIRRMKGLYQNVKGSIIEYIYRVKQMEGTRKVHINYTIIPENYEYIEEFADEAVSWGVRKITFQWPLIIDPSLGSEYEKVILHTFGRKAESWKGYLLKEKFEFDFEKLPDIAARINKKYSNREGLIQWSHGTENITKEYLDLYFNKTNMLLTDSFENKYCNKVIQELVVNSNGDVLICPDFLETVIGNITANRFQDFDNLDYYAKHFNNSNYFATCFRCVHRYRHVKFTRN